MQPLHVYDYEELFRSVRPNEFSVVDGRVVISASAFKDSQRKPSLDKQWYGRAAEETRKAPDNGVAKIVAAEARKISSVTILDHKGRPTGGHAVDVMHRPIMNQPGEPDNASHCQVECDPAIEKDGSFKRLKEALAGLATRHGWVLPPGQPTP